MEIKLGRVVGSKIRNGSEFPPDITKDNWLNGDIYIHNQGVGVPYYEYVDEKFNLLGRLQGSNGIISEVDKGKFSFFVANEDGTITDKTTGETLNVLKGDFVCVQDEDDTTEFTIDEEGNLIMITQSDIEFEESE